MMLHYVSSSRSVAASVGAWYETKRVGLPSSGSVHQPDGPGINDGGRCFAFAGAAPSEPQGAPQSPCCLGRRKNDDEFIASEDALNLDAGFLHRKNVNALLVSLGLQPGDDTSVRKGIHINEGRVEGIPGPLDLLAVSGTQQASASGVRVRLGLGGAVLVNIGRVVVSGMGATRRKAVSLSKANVRKHGPRGSPRASLMQNERAPLGR